MIRFARSARPLSLAVTIAGCVALAVACSSSEEAAPTRPLSPSPSPSPVGDAGDPDASNACFEGDPINLGDFLDACTDGQCAPFDNTARLPLYESGKPLPPAP